MENADFPNLVPLAAVMLKHLGDTFLSKFGQKLRTSAKWKLHEYVISIINVTSSCIPLYLTLKSLFLLPWIKPLFHHVRPQQIFAVLSGCFVVGKWMFKISSECITNLWVFSLQIQDICIWICVPKDLCQWFVRDGETAVPFTVGRSLDMRMIC